MKRIAFLLVVCLPIVSAIADTKVREGTQTQGALPAAQGGVPSGGTTGQVLTKNSSTSYDDGWSANSSVHSVSIPVQVASGVITDPYTSNQIKTYYGGTLVAWTASCKPSCSATIDILRSADGAGLPTVSIVGGGTKPSLSSTTENSGATFTDWTSTTVTAKDNFAVTVSGITAAQYVNLTLWFQ